MRKLLFILATCYLVYYLVWFLPAYGVSKQSFKRKYNATEREQIIITDVYDASSTTLTISLWSSIALYGLFAGSMLFTAGNKKKTIVHDNSQQDKV
jgi:hypothetical protein